MNKLLLFLLPLYLYSCTNNPPREIPPLEAYGMISNDFAILVDTNDNPTKIALNATNLSAKQLLTTQQLPTSFSKNKTIIFYGNQAQETAHFFTTKGYKCAYFKNIAQWEAAKLPLTP